jgi:hypothetical protein
MPLSFYLDDCSDEDLLITLLRHAGHTVISPRQARTVGWYDSDHLDYASRHDFTLITHNPQDFRYLHRMWQAQGLQHSGIFLIYRDNDPSRDMTPVDILRAIDRLIAAGLPINNMVHILNQWR